MQIENLTPTVERILRLAEIEAGKDRSLYVGANHVLIGMMLEGDNYASMNLSAAGFTVEGLRKRKHQPLESSTERQCVKTEEHNQQSPLQ